MRRSTVLLAVVLLALGSAAPVRAGGLVARLSVSEAAPGEEVRVTGEGWGPGQLLQFVTCGEGGVTGSAACDTRGALATPVRPDGTFVVDLTVGEPPRDCPCVVHIAAVQGDADAVVNLPITLTGHTVGQIPRGADPVRQLIVQDARLTGGTAAAWFGAPDRLTLIYTIRNPTTSTLVDATARVRLGGGGDDNVVHSEQITGLGPGQSRTLQVPVEIPLAAFGRYVVGVDVSGLAQARITFQAYPWGLFLINLLGLLLITWGVLRRVLRRGNDLAWADPSRTMLPSVVRLGSLGAFLVFDDAPGARRLRRMAGAQLSLDHLRAMVGQGTGPGGGDSVLDLDALGHVMARRYPREITLFEEEER
jgi:fluoride ion exporter CrcB/FEX